jgi:hypothetical protein
VEQALTSEGSIGGQLWPQRAQFDQHFGTPTPLDDCLYDLQATIPNLTRSSLQRHVIGKLPDVDGEKPSKKHFRMRAVAKS